MTRTTSRAVPSATSSGVTAGVKRDEAVPPCCRAAPWWSPGRRRSASARTRRAAARRPPPLPASPAADHWPALTARMTSCTCWPRRGPRTRGLTVSWNSTEARRVVVQHQVLDVDLVLDDVRELAAAAAPADARRSATRAAGGPGAGAPCAGSARRCTRSWSGPSCPRARRPTASRRRPASLPGERSRRRSGRARSSPRSSAAAARRPLSPSRGRSRACRARAGRPPRTATGTGGCTSSSAAPGSRGASGRRPRCRRRRAAAAISSTAVFVLARM